MNNSNNFHLSISFSHSYSSSAIHFLDVTDGIVSKKLTTKLYKTPTDVQDNLHFTSSHHRHCKTVVPYRQAHHFKRVCASQDDFNRNCEILRDTFVIQKSALY